MRWFQGAFFCPREKSRLVDHFTGAPMRRLWSQGAEALRDLLHAGASLANPRAPDIAAPTMRAAAPTRSPIKCFFSASPPAPFSRLLIGRYTRA